MYRRYELDADLAARLARRRRALRLTQAQLARRLDCSESTVMRLESLRVPFTPARRAAFEDALAAFEGAVDEA